MNNEICSSELYYTLGAKGHKESWADNQSAKDETK